MLTRFGPMFDIERLGGAFTLAALAVPEERFEDVAEQLHACLKWRTTTDANTPGTCGLCSAARPNKVSPRPCSTSKP